MNEEEINLLKLTNFFGYSVVRNLESTNYLLRFSDYCGIIISPRLVQKFWN